MTRAEFAARYRSLAETFQRYGLASQARLCDDVLADFDQVCRDDDSAELTLEDAARRSGYSADHLRRLHHQGRLAAQRRGGRLYFRAADLPRKPATVDGVPKRAYDPIAHARQVAIRRSHGGRTHDTQEAA